MNDMNHGKTITTQSYYDGVITSTKEELEVSLFTDRANILKDIIEGLSLINSGQTTKLSLEVSVDNKQRLRLIKKWEVV